MRLGDIQKMVAGTLGVIQMLPELKAGGVERGTLELSRFLVRRGHRSLVVSQGGPMVDQLRSDGGRHIRMPYIGEKSPRCLLHLWALRRLFRENRIDIVHMRSRLPAWMGYLAWRSLAAGRRPRLVTTFHGFYSVNAYSAIMTKGERVIAISKAVADHIHRYYRIDPSKITLIYRGVDADYFHPSKVDAERIARVKEKWRVREDTPIIMLPGRVTFWKGHDLFIKALARMRDIAWRAVCVGAFDSESTHFKNLKHLLKELALSDRVQFTGNEADMPAAYAAVDLVVSAATEEPEAFGRVSIEAQAMARPIVASAHGGSLETVVHGQTGWLFEPGDTVELSNVLRMGLSRPDLCRQYATEGFRRVHQNFTTLRMCQSTLNLYEQLLMQKFVEMRDGLR